MFELDTELLNIFLLKNLKDLNPPLYIRTLNLQVQDKLMLKYFKQMFFKTTKFICFCCILWKRKNYIFYCISAYRIILNFQSISNRNIKYISRFKHLHANRFSILTELSVKETMRFRAMQTRKNSQLSLARKMKYSRRDRSPYCSQPRSRESRTIKESVGAVVRAGSQTCWIR